MLKRIPGKTGRNIGPVTMKSLRVLLVEDDRDSAEALELLLRSNGFEVEWVPSARATLEIYQKDPSHHVDLILLDLMLPDLDGVSLIARLSTITDLPPLVIHSAVSAPAAKAAAEQIGAAAVLRKPADWREMRQVLEGLAAAKSGE
jgi:DNA-binding response OmpR family regulator